VVPFYHDILIDPEDSVVIQEDRSSLAPVRKDRINVAVLKLPAISNFTDLDALKTEPDVTVNYVFKPRDLTPDYDLLILPGTKNAMEDARWLSLSGWKRALRQFASMDKEILGICGGYQLLGKRILDPSGVESGMKQVRGLDLLPVETVLEKEKVVRKVAGLCLASGKPVSGYEIHMGQSRILGPPGGAYLKIRLPGGRLFREDGCTLQPGRVSGTYVHGILDAPGFRGDLLNRLRRGKGLRERKPGPGRRARFHQYDRLARHFEAHCDVESILSFLHGSST
jgi:adenosylcobyric acid synthase